MERSYETIRLGADEQERSLLVVTLNRPEKRNSLSDGMARDLFDVFVTRRLAEEGYRCVVITGKGSAFCSGADLMQRMGPDKTGQKTEDWLKDHRTLKPAIAGLMDCPLPTIAAVNGDAIGGGFEIVQACDLAYASVTARFAMTEASLGFMPGCGGTLNLSRILGPRVAMQVLLTSTAGRANEQFDAQRLLEWRFLNDVFEPAQLMTATLAIARRICTRAPAAVRNIKQAVRLAIVDDLNTLRKQEGELYDELIATDDRMIGMRAFWANRKRSEGEWRAPEFTGR